VTLGTDLDPDGRICVVYLTLASREALRLPSCPPQCEWAPRGWTSAGINPQFIGMHETRCPRS